MTTPMIWLQSHHGAAAAENVPVCDSGINAEDAEGDEKKADNANRKSEDTLCDLTRKR